MRTVLEWPQSHATSKHHTYYDNKETWTTTEAPPWNGQKTITGGLNRFYGIPISPSASIMAQNIQLFGPREGFLTQIGLILRCLIVHGSLLTNITDTCIWESGNNFKLSLRTFWIEIIDPKVPPNDVSRRWFLFFLFYFLFYLFFISGNKYRPFTDEVNIWTDITLLEWDRFFKNATKTIHFGLPLKLRSWIKRPAKCQWPWTEDI